MHATITCSAYIVSYQCLMCVLVCIHAYTVQVYVYGIIICHPLPSNSQQETTNSMSHVTVVAGLLLTLDHYQPQISLKPHIKYCTLDDKIVA